MGHPREPLNQGTADQIVRDCETLVSKEPSVDRAFPHEWDRRLAYAVSMIGSPPVLTTATTALTAARLASPGVWQWAASYVSLAVVAPMVYILWQVRQGRLSDLDVQLREQRARPLVLSVVCGGLAWLLLALGPAPTKMVVLAGGLWLQLVIVLGVTLRWKISMHSAAAASAATVAWSLLGTPLPLLIGVPLIAWSRVRLQRHTFGQTAAGALLGFSVFAAALWVAC